MELDENRNANGLEPEDVKKTSDDFNKDFAEETEDEENKASEDEADGSELDELLTKEPAAEPEDPDSEDDEIEKLLEASLESGDLQQVESKKDTDEKKFDEDDYNGPRCVRCGTPVSAGVDYCLLCQHEITAAPLKAGGFIAGILLLLISLAAVVLLAPTLEIYTKVLEGDANIADSNYAAALTSYGGAKTAASDYNTDYNTLIGDKSYVFFSSGDTVCKEIRATNVYSGLIEAGSLIKTYYSNNRVPAEIKDIFDDYQKIEPTYTAISTLYSDYYSEYYQAMSYGQEFTGEVSYKEFSDKLDDAIAKNPDYVKYIAELFRFYASTMTSEADEIQLKDLLKVKELAPDEYWLYCSELMSMYSSMEMYDEAVEAADIALAHNFQTAKAYIFKAEALFSSEKYEDCIATVEEDVAKNPDTATTYVYKIRSLYLLGKKDEAFEYCESLYDGDNTDSSYYAMKAELYRMDKNYETALKACKDGLAIDDENIELFRQQAIIYMLKNDTASAKKALTTAYDLGATLELVYTIAVYSTMADDETWYKEIDDLLKKNNLEMPDMVKQYVDGKLTLEDIYISGKGDVS